MRRSRRECEVTFAEFVRSFMTSSYAFPMNLCSNRRKFYWFTCFILPQAAARVSFPETGISERKRRKKAVLSSFLKLTSDGLNGNPQYLATFVVF